jgi:hypothetical protein
VVEVLDLQRSQYGPSYYVNLGFWLLAVATNRSPKIPECHARVRLETLTEKAGGERSDIEAAFDLGSELDEASRAGAIRDALTRYLLPVIERGSTVDGLRSLRKDGTLPAVRRQAQALLA